MSEEAGNVMYDTQIVSYAMKNVAAFDVGRGRISSVVAQEFLCLQASGGRRLRYPVHVLEGINKNLGVGEVLTFLGHRARTYSRNRISPTRGESFSIYLGSSYPTVVERGHRGTAMLVNSGLVSWFGALVSGLDKSERRRLLGRFEFLAANGMQCAPLHRDDVPVALELLDDFLASRQPKSNFRNTVNDILILAMAMRRKMDLVTEDKLLAEFSRHRLKSKVTTRKGYERIHLAELVDTPAKADSKRYVNRAWRFKRVSDASVGASHLGSRWTSY